MYLLSDNFSMEVSVADTFISLCMKEDDFSNPFPVACSYSHSFQQQIFSAVFNFHLDQFSSTRSLFCQIGCCQVCNLHSTFEVSKMKCLIELAKNPSHGVRNWTFAIAVS